MRLAQLLFCLVITFLAVDVSAACPPGKLTPPEQLHLAGNSALIVTHATSFHDARFSTKRGVDEAVRFAKENRIPVIYLQDDSPGEFYFAEDCAPDYRVFSEGGELKFELAASHLYVIGGHLEMCMSHTLEDALYSWAKQPKRDLTITFFMDAIYSNGKSVEPSDPFYEDFKRFMGIVTYGRPGGEHWPKLSLLETMGLIISEQHELDYLKKVLPNYARTMPEGYRVELQLNDSVAKVLQPAAGWKPPVLRFHFVDTAIGFKN
ncbi:MAG: hypothetical protein H6943_06310 [Zoogloeaceae bacterium]|nr:hypothetical protein [Zoogloeaceae bacterium]